MSVCVTNYNSGQWIRDSMESIISQCDPNMEIVVADNQSTDGSKEYLERLHSQGWLKLTVARCTRGKGRQIALEQSVGDYIVAGIDTDTIYRQVFSEIIDTYQRAFEGKLLVLRGLQVSSRSVISGLGWKDLQWGEDRELWDRAAGRGMLVVFDYDPRLGSRRMGGVAPQRRLRYLAEMARDTIRAGFSYPAVAAETRSVSSCIALACFYVPSLVLDMAHGGSKERYDTNFRIEDYYRTGFSLGLEPGGKHPDSANLGAVQA